MALDDLARLAAAEHGLVIVATRRADGTIQSSLVNAGVLAHPVTGVVSAAFVTYGPVKLGNLRRRPQVTLTARSGWHWHAVEGHASIVGPDDPHPEVDAERLRLLLREVFTAAGGQHDDWDAYDRTMREQGRSAVFVEPLRDYGN